MMRRQMENFKFTVSLVSPDSIDYLAFLVLPGGGPLRLLAAGVRVLSSIFIYLKCYQHIEVSSCPGTAILVYLV